MAESDAIRDAMLDDTSDEYDKSEGSIIYDVHAATAPEIYNLGVQIGDILGKRFLDSAAGDDLDRATTEFGVDRKSAEYATGTVTLTGTPDVTVSAGALVASGAAKFMTQNDVTIGSGGTVDVGVVCTTAGIVGNVGTGSITKFPVTISGVTAVTNTAATSGGYDEETDSVLRERTYSKIRTPGTSGNANDYRNWALSVDGVGGAKVVPIWNGGGTVKVVIVDSNGAVADAGLITDVSDYIETVRPVGALVTVVSATTVDIDVVANITISSDYDSTEVNAAIVAAITAYLQTFRLSGAEVSYAKIGAIILGVDGVEDYTGLTVNTGTVNIVIGATEVPVMGAYTNGA